MVGPVQQGTLKGRRCFCQSLLCLVGLVPEQAAVTTIALCPYQPPGTKLLRAQLKSHLFNSFDKHLHRPWDKVPLGSPVYLGRQKKTRVTSVWARGLVAGKGMAHWKNCKKCGVVSPHSMCVQIPEALGALMGLEQQITWSGLTT